MEYYQEILKSGTELRYVKDNVVYGYDVYVSDVDPFGNKHFRYSHWIRYAPNYAELVSDKPAYDIQFENEDMPF